jgi:hypothetical protein
MKVIETLKGAVRMAAKHNSEVQEKPACILWPDGERQWESVISRLQAEMPELFQLGEYLPGKRVGPAIWLRCVIVERFQVLHFPMEQCRFSTYQGSRDKTCVLSNPAPNT